MNSDNKWVCHNLECFAISSVHVDLGFICKETCKGEASKMFEARLVQGNLLKRIIDSVKDLLNEATWNCNAAGIELQAMDTSHVALVSVSLHGDGFGTYTCDRPFSMGMNISSMSKIFKCAASDDVVTVRAQQECDFVTFVFESPQHRKVAQYEMRLMNLDQEQLEIPETSYLATIHLSSQEFQRIIRDLSQFGESVVISCVKNEVTFSTLGDMGTGSIKLGLENNNESVQLSFACQYLNHFSKASCLAPTVAIHMSPDIPIMLEYKIGELGHIRYYLAPKVDDV